MPDATSTVWELRDLVARFLQEREWERYHNPKDLAIAMAVEAGELLELFQWKTVEEIDLNDAAFREALEDEIADVFIYTLHLTNAIGGDLSDIASRKIAKNAEKYPVDRYRGKAR